MMNKNILLCIYLTMGFLLYDLYFDIAWLFCPHNRKIVYLVIAVVRVHIVLQWLQYLSQAFQTFMCPLHPFKAPIFFGDTNPSLL